MKNIKFKLLFGLFFVISVEAFSLTITIKNETKFPIEFRYGVLGRDSSMKIGGISEETTKTVSEKDCLSEKIVVKPRGDKPTNLPLGGSLYWPGKICSDLTLKFVLGANNRIEVIRE